MEKTFKIKGIEYYITRNPSNNSPMVARVDNKPVDNRKEVCRMFLLLNGWNQTMFGNKTTQCLEREVYKIIGEITERPTNQPKVVKEKPTKKDIPAITIEEAKRWLNHWHELEDYTAQEDAINRLFNGEFKSNDNLQNILIKCSVLNDFYSTNIFKIYPVAKHILELNIDGRLKVGDSSLVNDIALVNISGVEKNFYSFATKYCSHHNPVDYPIYDSYVAKVLNYYHRKDRFADFNEIDLKQYTKFKDILIKFRSFYKLEQLNLKELDMFLWQYGKEYFPNNY